MANLFQETLEIMQEHNKTPEDVDWVGSIDGEYVCTWEEFVKLADREYNNRWNLPQVAMDLVIVFKDGSWLERYVCDEREQSEWWEFKQTPKKKEQTKKIKQLFADDADYIGWAFLKDLH